MKLLLNGGGDGVRISYVKNLLNEIIDHNKKILYIPLAWVEDPTYISCLEYMTNELRDIKCNGIEMVTSASEICNKTLTDYAFIFIGGGNTYKLLKELKENNCLEKIKDYLLNEQGIVYGGSAGSIIFGKDIENASFLDPNDVNLLDTTGFNMVNGYSVFCHYTFDEEKNDYLIELSKKGPIYAIYEEDTIFVTEESIKIIGPKPYYEFKDGKMIKNDVGGIYERRI